MRRPSGPVAGKPGALAVGGLELHAEYEEFQAVGHLRLTGLRSVEDPRCIVGEAIHTGAHLPTQRLPDDRR
ncbi:hypothetical protein GCM10010252_77010 [Streptomyces aureoverticillatus]|nr:hypothetical protein GCM10010252_77010 [Streptomyces aureoverticillatus]